jgi:hypothetical protein
MDDKYEIEIDATGEGAAALESIDETAGAIEEKFASINRQLDEMFGYIDAIGGKVTDVGATLRTALSTLSTDVGLAKMREWTSPVRDFTDEVIRFGDQLETKTIPNMETFIDLVSESEGPAEPWSTKLPLITEDDGEFEKEIGKIRLKVAPYYKKFLEEETTAPTGTDSWIKPDSVWDYATMLGIEWMLLGAAVANPTVALVIAGIISQLAIMAGMVALADWAMPEIGEAIGVYTPGPIGQIEYLWSMAKDTNALLMQGGTKKLIKEFPYEKYKTHGAYKEWKEANKQKNRIGIDWWPNPPKLPPGTERSKLWGGGKGGWMDEWRKKVGLPSVYDTTDTDTEVGDYWGKKWVREMFPGLGAGEGTLGAGESAYTGGALPGFWFPGVYIEPEFPGLQQPPEDIPPELWRFWKPSPILPYIPGERLPQYERPTEPWIPPWGHEPLEESTINYGFWEPFWRDLGEGARAEPSLSPEDFVFPGGYTLGALASVYGGEGGAGGAGRTTTAYLTIEKVDINTTEKVDADSLIEMVRNIYNIEADTLS